MKKILFLVAFLVITMTSISQPAREKGYSTITMESIQGQLEFLASDWMEGRATGTKGIYMASDYIASMYKVFGIKPFGDEIFISPSREEARQGVRPRTERTYFQNITLLQYEPGEDQRLSVSTQTGPGESATEFGYQVDFQVQTGTTSISGKAPVFFAGYGMTDKDFDDYKKKDVKGKVVMILSGFPGHRDTTSAAYRKFKPEQSPRFRYMVDRMKVQKAEELGAVAVILVNPDANPAMNWTDNNHYPVKGAYYEADQQLSSFYDKRLTLPGDTLTGNIPVFTVTNRVTNLILKESGIDIATYESQAMSTMQSISADIPNKSVSWSSTVNSKLIKCRNVVGVLEGKKKDEFIVIGAHYDHLGKHDGWIWNGADDNGSGTVGVMTLARALKESGELPEKSIIFAAWTAEEVGLFGSRFFVRNFPKSLNIAYNLNFDMLSRNDPSDTNGNTMSMMYTSFTPKLKDLTEKNIAEKNLNVVVNFRGSATASGGSDHAPFAQAGIPATFFFAGMHPDYHQPSDELSKLNWDKMLNLIRLGYLNIWDLSNNDSWLERQ